MSFLTQQTFAQLVQLQTEQFGVAAGQPARTDAGSTLGSFFDAVALLGVQLEQQIAYENLIARLATSSGADVDTFVNPFGVFRLAATYAFGPETFSIPSPSGTQLVIPLGTVVQTPGGVQFMAVADTTNGAYSASANGYILPSGQTSVSVTVAATVGGTIGNVQANQITVVYGGPGGSPLPASFIVTNPNPFNDAQNTETDQALKTRFAQYVSGAHAGTSNSIRAAVNGVQPGLTFSVGDGLAPNGSPESAFFTVVVNVAGSGTAPSAVLLSEVTAAVEEVRPAGISYTVVGPTLIPVAASGTLTYAPGYNAATVAAAVNAAYIAFANSIGLNPLGSSTTLSYGQVYAVLFGVAGVQNIDGLLLNGGTSDVVASFGQQVVAGTSSFA